MSYKIERKDQFKPFAVEVVGIWAVSWADKLAT